MRYFYALSFLGLLWAPQTWAEKALPFSDSFFAPPAYQTSFDFRYRSESFDYTDFSQNIGGYERVFEKKEAYALKGMHSLSPQFALFTTLTYSVRNQDRRSSQSQSFNGLEDLEVGAQEIKEVGPRLHLLLGSSAFFSLERHREPRTGVDGNNATGTYALAPFIGAEWSDGTSTLGTRLSSRFPIGYVETLPSNPPASARATTKLEMFDEISMSPDFSLVSTLTVGHDENWPASVPVNLAEFELKGLLRFDDNVLAHIAILQQFVDGDRPYSETLASVGLRLTF